MTITRPGRQSQASHTSHRSPGGSFSRAVSNWTLRQGRRWEERGTLRVALNPRSPATQVRHKVLVPSKPFPRFRDSNPPSPFHFSGRPVHSPGKLATQATTLLTLQLRAVRGDQGRALDATEAQNHSSLATRLRNQGPQDTKAGGLIQDQYEEPIQG